LLPSCDSGCMYFLAVLACNVFVMLHGQLLLGLFGSQDIGCRLDSANSLAIYLMLNYTFFFSWVYIAPSQRHLLELRLRRGQGDAPASFVGLVISTIKVLSGRDYHLTSKHSRHFGWYWVVPVSPVWPRARDICWMKSLWCHLSSILWFPGTQYQLYSFCSRKTDTTYVWSPQMSSEVSLFNLIGVYFWFKRSGVCLWTELAHCQKEIKKALGRQTNEVCITGKELTRPKISFKHASSAVKGMLSCARNSFKEGNGRQMDKLT
jgi:hypothetical protein